MCSLWARLSEAASPSCSVSNQQHVPLLPLRLSSLLCLCRSTATHACFQSALLYCVGLTAQFGPGKLPQHGFARNKLWKHGETTVNKASGDITTAFHLSEDDDTLKVWPHQFELVLTIVLKATSLSQQLTVKNTGSESFDFNTLLHTYLHVDNILTTQVSHTRTHTARSTELWLLLWLSSTADSLSRLLLRSVCQVRSEGTDVPGQAERR